MKHYSLPIQLVYIVYTLYSTFFDKYCGIARITKFSEKKIKLVDKVNKILSVVLHNVLIVKKDLQMKGVVKMKAKANDATICLPKISRWKIYRTSGWFLSMKGRLYGKFVERYVAVLEKKTARYMKEEELLYTKLTEESTLEKKLLEKKLEAMRSESTASPRTCSNIKLLEQRIAGLEAEIVLYKTIFSERKSFIDSVFQECTTLLVSKSKKE